ncbi:MAG: acyclic terpene utilization AtuA family protein, partial [bacterium]
MFRIANGQGFWGDLPQAPAKQVHGGPIDVLCLEYLAEVTLGILARMKQKDSSGGYIPDFIEQMDELWEECISNNITVVTSAGGINPRACARDVESVLLERGIDADIACVTGDDCMDELTDWLEKEELEPEDQELLENHEDQILAANRYFGSKGLTQAYREGADVIIAGRVTDTSLVLGPAMAELNWSDGDYDSLATGIVAGHILECGGQATGGNFSGNSEEIDDLWNIGFPIAKFNTKGELKITKHESLGGTVNERTVSEQILYKLTDPSAYKTPDVTVDFRNIELEETDSGVRIRGIEGSPPPSTDKISVLYQDGFQVSGHLTYCGPDPVEKTAKAESILRNRLADIGREPERLEVENVGYNACHRELSSADSNAQDEVLFRVAAHDSSREYLREVGKQLMGLLLTGPPGATGFAEGRPPPPPVIK